MHLYIISTLYAIARSIYSIYYYIVCNKLQYHFRVIIRNLTKYKEIQAIPLQACHAMGGVGSSPEPPFCIISINSFS